ncbi:hypothetical protein GCM10010182_47350 [Actinomadura cremea]|nr:hypothetical protein GCM10010182_47350 [Actinomadura cremea]
MWRTGGAPRARGPLTPLFVGAAVSGAVALVVGLAASCGPDGREPDARASSSAPAPSPAGTAAPVLPPGYSPTEPVVDDSFADPAAIKVGDTYFAYGTNGGDAMMPVATAPGPAGPWTRSPGDGLASLPAWAEAGWTWAPEVVPPRRQGDPYLLYFTARRRDADVQCIGIATATSPAGPFVPRDGDPLVCPAHLGGAIDAASFVEDDGTRFLLYKSDARATAAIYLMQLTSDGLEPAAPASRILGRSGDEPVLVEAPDLVKRGGKYVLFYSAGWYFESNYQTRYAVAPSIWGPYEKGPAPIQSTELYGEKVEGPGSADVLSDGTGDYLLFHGITEYHGGSKVTRPMYVAPLGWDGTRPVVRGVPTRYEVEAGQLNGCVSALPRPNASGGKAAGPFARDDCGADVRAFAPVAGEYEVRVQYANRSGEDSDLQVTVNGAAAASMRLGATDGADWTSETVRVRLTGGWNTLGLRRLSGPGRPAGKGQLDYLEVR